VIALQSVLFAVETSSLRLHEKAEFVRIPGTEAQKKLPNGQIINQRTNIFNKELSIPPSWSRGKGTFKER